MFIAGCTWNVDRFWAKGIADWIPSVSLYDGCANDNTPILMVMFPLLVYLCWLLGLFMFIYEMAKLLIGNREYAMHLCIPLQHIFLIASKFIVIMKANKDWKSFGCEMHSNL